MGFLGDIAEGVADIFAKAGEEGFAEAGGNAYVAAAAAVEAENQRLRRLPTEISSGHKLALRPQFGDLVDEARVIYEAYTLEGFEIAGQKIGASARGQTYGHLMYIKPKRDEEFDSLLRLLAHELTHARQWVQAGRSLRLFGNRYFRAYFRAGFVYSKNEMEDEADQVASCLMARRSATIALATSWRPQPAWTTGWTDFAAFELGGAPHYLAHKSGTGEIAIDRINADGAGSTTVWRDRPAAGRVLARWTSLTAFAEAGQPYFLGYNADSGDAAIHKIRPDAKGIERVWRPASPWTKGWTSFMPFVLGGKPHYLAYKSGSGEVAIDRVEAGGLGARTLWRPSKPWSKGWTSFAPFRRGSDVFYFAYKAGDGDAAIDRILPDGSGVEESWRVQHRWEPGYTSVIPLELGNETYLLLYSGPQRFGLADAISGSGRAAIFEIRATDGTPRRVWCDYWTKGWTNFVPFQVTLSGTRSPHYLAYKQNHGDVAIDRLSRK